MRQYWRYSLIPILFLVVIPVILAILLYPLLAQSQDMKSFTFHTDATVGNGDEVDITGLTLVGVTITGSTTSNRAVTFEVADSIGTYSAVKCVDIDTLVVFEGVTLSGVAPHRFQCPVGGFKKFRVRISGGTTGTINAVGLGLSKAFRGITPSSGNTGGGSSIVLDLGDNGSNESIALSEIATLGDTFGIFSESSPDKLLVDVSKKWPSSFNADALSVVPTPCASPNFARGILVNGNATCVQVSFADLAGTASDAQIPNLNTLSTGLTPGRCVETSGTGLLISTGSACGAGAGSGLPSDPPPCPTNQFVIDQSQSGTLSCAQPSISNLSDGNTIVPITRSVTINGTTNQITVTGGTQDLSVNRTWTIALANNPTIPGTTTGSFVGPLNGNASTATALAADPSPCPINQFGIDTTTSGALVCAQPSSSALSDASQIVKTALPQQISNKQNIPREITMTPSAGAIIPDCDGADIIVVNAISAPLTVNAPTCVLPGNPVPSQEIDFRFFCSSSQPITWNAAFSETAGVPKLAVCTGDGTTFDYAKVRRNSINSKWEFIATKASGKGVTTVSGTVGTFNCDAGISSQCVMRNTTTAGTGITINNPGGTPSDGQLIMWVVRCTAAQTIVYGTKIIDSPNVVKPTSCSVDAQKYTMLGARYSLLDDLWQVIAAN